MNVFFLSLDLFSIGGIQRYSRYVLQSLARASNVGRVTVASLAPPAWDGGFGDIRVDLTGGRSPLRKLMFVPAALRAMRSARPSLMICDHINIAPIAWVFGAITGTPYVLNVYAIDVWGPLPWLRRRALLAASRIVSDCEFTRDYLENGYPQLVGRITVVPDCVDTNRFTANPIRSTNTPPIILTVARLSDARSKGHDVVLRALGTLHRRGIDARYVIAGDGPGRARLEALAADLGVEASVTFLGAVEEAALPDVYRSCDVFALVSAFDTATGQGEGVPLVVLEAQACGKPVVTSRCDGSAESIVDGETGLLVDPADVSAVAERLALLLQDGDLRERMGAAARRLAERRFAVPVFDAAFGAIVDSFAAPAPETVALPSEAAIR